MTGPNDEHDGGDRDDHEGEREQPQPPRAPSIAWDSPVDEPEGGEDDGEQEGERRKWLCSHDVRGWSADLASQLLARLLREPCTHRRDPYENDDEGTVTATERWPCRREHRADGGERDEDNGGVNNEGMQRQTQECFQTAQHGPMLGAHYVMAVTWEADLALALRLADEADAITMARFGALDLHIQTKPDLTPVTEADTAAERRLRDLLASERPDDSILGEEFGTEGSASRRWIIDPIDGTKNYVRGVPVWATLIALTVGDDVVVGVASSPALGRRWWASAGNGAFVRVFDAEPRRLHVSSVASLADASLSFSDAIGWDRAPGGLSSLLRSTWRQRAYGDFWSHVLVAEGVVDLAAEPELGPWDMAALIPIVVEAGGRITAFDGGSAMAGGCAVTTNGHLHDEAIAVLGSKSG